MFCTNSVDHNFSMFVKCRPQQQFRHTFHYRNMIEWMWRRNKLIQISSHQSHLLLLYAAWTLMCSFMCSFETPPLQSIFHCLVFISSSCNYFRKFKIQLLRSHLDSQELNILYPIAACSTPNQSQCLLYFYASLNGWYPKSYLNLSTWTHPPDAATLRLIAAHLQVLVVKTNTCNSGTLLIRK